MWRCVLEGIGYDYMEITDRYRSAGIDLTQLTITEGGSRDALWNQIKADMLNTEVVVLKISGGAVPTNCIVAAYGTGDIADLEQALRRQLIVAGRFFPNRDTIGMYRDNYEKRRYLLKALNMAAESAGKL
jgi:xylulokinase